ncbi:MAG: hypothetical protein CBE43_01625 [Rhodopirellula sp. TMED283]|nr:MAG: hypothetical protein CBE43_01625 [Rhodopirellula sp. TMED283]
MKPRSPSAQLPSYNIASFITPSDHEVERSLNALDFPPVTSCAVGFRIHFQQHPKFPKNSPFGGVTMGMLLPSSTNESVFHTQ